MKRRLIMRDGRYFGTGKPASKKNTKPFAERENRNSRANSMEKKRSAVSA